MANDNVRQVVDKLIRERAPEQAEEEQAAPKKVMIGGQFYWHTVKKITWNNLVSWLHLFVNVTADHELTLQKAANSYMRIMLGSITHELRTPLNSSTNAIEMLEGQVTADQEKQLKTVKTSNQMLSSLIEDILDLTRLEAGQFQLNKERFSIKEVVHQLDDLFRF